MSGSRIVAWVAALLVVGSAEPSAAAAPTRDECAAASEDAQLLKLKHQLRAAREKLVVCGDERCPAVVREDCNRLLDEVSSAEPTIVLAARDRSGHDLTRVRVWLDGAPLVDQLDGKAVAVDPGEHMLRFEAEGSSAHEERIVVREGEKSRAIAVVLDAAAAAAAAPTVVTPNPAPVSAPAAATAPPEAEHRRPSSATWLVGGIGAAVLVAAGVIGVVALEKRSSLYDRCGKTSTCKQSEVDSVYRLYNISYAGAAIGGVLVGTSVLLYFTTEERRTATTPRAGITVSGHF